MANETQSTQRDATVEQIIDTGRAFYRFGWVAANSGNASRRLDDNILVTATGADLGALSGGDFAVVDPEGNPEDHTVEPSEDTDVHLAIYRHLEEAEAVFHLHHLEAALCSDRDNKRGFTHLHEVQMIRALGIEFDDGELAVELPIVEPDGDHGDLVETIERRLDDDPPDAPCINVKNHGLYVWGSDLDAVRRHAEACAYLFEYAWQRPMNPKTSSSISGFNT